MRWLLAYAVTAIVFLGLDFVWLTMIAFDIYQSELRDVLAADVNYTAAAVFYLIYVAGIMVLAIRPAGSVAAACFNGAVLGLVAYATYELTNLATLKIWSLTVTVLDIGWGAIVTAVAAGAGYLARGTRS